MATGFAQAGTSAKFNDAAKLNDWKSRKADAGNSIILLVSHATRYRVDDCRVPIRLRLHFDPRECVAESRPLVAKTQLAVREAIQNNRFKR